MRRVSLKTSQPFRGNALLSYITDGFFLGPNATVPTTHSNIWESTQIARTLLEFGFDVDVISYNNQSFSPAKSYDLILDVRWNLERLLKRLPSNCLRLAHLDTAHWMFQNAATYQRLLELHQRRGFTLNPSRFSAPNFLLEHADCGSIHGNAFTIGTYAHARKPLYPIPLPTTVQFSWNEDKDWELARRSVLFFNSSGMVHKGLDLALEAFAEMPDFRLVVCCPVSRERDFEAAFHKELYETSNIETVGWIDVESARFRRIINESVAILCLSCSEGQSGSVITCTHAGLVPIVSRQSGVDVEDFGLVLDQCSVSQIKCAVQRMADLTPNELAERSRAAWKWGENESYSAEICRGLP